jgi:glycosyltransferase involved in cell wall biosynthesis
MRIVYIIPSIDVRGASIVFEQADRLAQNGHEIILTTLDEPKNSTRYPLSIIPSKLEDARKEFDKADVFIGFNPVCAFYVNDIETKAQKYCLLLNDEMEFINKDYLKIITKLDDQKLEIEYEDQKKYIESAYSLPLIYLTPNLKLKSLLAGFSRVVSLVPIGVNQELFYPDQYVPKNDVVRILVESSSSPWSGTSTVNRALSDMRSFELWTTGSQVIKSDKHWNLPDANLKRKILSSCDIYTNMGEIDGTAESLLHAMACGVAVVCSETDGSRMFCKDGINCSYVSGNDEKEKSENLKNTLEELIKDKEKRNSLIIKGLETAQSMNWDIKPLEDILCLKQ